MKKREEAVKIIRIFPPFRTRVWFWGFGQEGNGDELNFITNSEQCFSVKKPETKHSLRELEDISCTCLVISLEPRNVRVSSIYLEVVYNVSLSLSLSYSRFLRLGQPSSPLAKLCARHPSSKA